ncbi:AraC family transcriptional regulator [Piscinibacter gummiphilus]|uniref:AraC family transcriptional regulator n=1 Tax=Piscinibacter gummiphilus TaxID=946333 RepID=A0A1W6L6G0_9BURK|nr:AraC family transcriptional regulator [Piscinibacter gummiphilus]ARN19718.1 AraC family transcriptional regulator [Piscinibacter gummiphilus]ATU64389.1 AraC family transcriptional regulator [Piscinibacter gummiphilus]GLS95215.1 transcriptional regulator [Piscinibacter gummiphilus]
MKTALTHYHARMQRVLEHIDQHLDDDLDLETLSRVAVWSKFHFHRQFSATFGLTVHRYIQLTRMKRASYQLAYRSEQSVTDVALDAGYDAPDAFARAFRQQVGQAPSVFRNGADWASWFAAFEPLNNARSKLMTRTFTLDDVTLREEPATPVAIMKHRGDPAMFGATLQRFIAWRKANGLHPRHHATFNVWRSEKSPADPADYDVDLCVGIDPHQQTVQREGERIERGAIPGGRCAVLRVVGHTDDLEPAALFLYRTWLPASGETLRDFPIYCRRLSFFPEVAEHEAVAELFLPLE